MITPSRVGGMLVRTVSAASTMAENAGRRADVVLVSVRAKAIVMQHGWPTSRLRMRRGS